MPAKAVTSTLYPLKALHHQDFAVYRLDLMLKSSLQHFHKPAGYPS